MRTIAIIIFLLATNIVYAQNFREWFKQKKTQREYLLKQIALLKIQIKQVKKGITIVQRGLSTIKNVKNGEVNLHKDFIRHLDKVNPAIASSAKVADIIAYQVHINKQLKEVSRYVRTNKNFTAEEARFAATVYTDMLALSLISIDELMTIIKPEKLKMSDDERLSQVDRLHEETLGRKAFADKFNNEARLLGYEREREQLEIRFLTTQY